MLWRRRKSLVNPRQQLWFSLELLALAASFNILCAFFFFMPPFSDWFGGSALNIRLWEDIQTAILLKWPMVVASAAVFVVIGVLVSHRLWGPLFGLKMVLESWLEGDQTARVRFRKYDYLLPMRDTFNRYFDQQEALSNSVKELCETVRGETASGNLDRIKAKCQELEGLLSAKEEEE